MMTRPSNAERGSSELAFSLSKLAQYFRSGVPLDCNDTIGKCHP